MKVFMYDLIIDHRPFKTFRTFLMHLFDLSHFHISASSIDL